MPSSSVFDTMRPFNKARSGLQLSPLLKLLLWSLSCRVHQSLASPSRHISLTLPPQGLLYWIQQVSGYHLIHSPILIGIWYNEIWLGFLSKLSPFLHVILTSFLNTLFHCPLTLSTRCLYLIRWVLASSLCKLSPFLRLVCSIFINDLCYDFKRLRQLSTVVGSKGQVMMSLEECKS